ncbi:MAG: Rid family hydrolase [Bilophila wadsworthia]
MRREACARPFQPQEPRQPSEVIRRRQSGQSAFPFGQLCANGNGPLRAESVAAQTRRIMENIKAIIEEAGGTLDAVVHCRAFLSDMKHFPEFESVYNRIFPLPIRHG